MPKHSRMTIILIAALFFGCGGRMPEGIGASQGMLAPCPDKPNCVSSFAKDAEHAIPAMRLIGESAEVWTGLQSILSMDGSVLVVSSDDRYIHAVYTSTIMRYRDDIEFLLMSDQGEIAVRSASRVGHSDLGVNRERVEAIRSQLASRGLAGAREAD